jgi:hypothetical protein
MRGLIQAGGASAFVALAVLACASGGGLDANRARFERDVGVATYTQGHDLAIKVLRQNQFELERETDPPVLYLETRWRGRVPFEDEQALGIGAAQVRIIVRGNVRNTTSMQGDLYSVSMVVENRVQLRNSVDWSDGTATAQYRQWAQRVTDDLKRELDVGVRTFGTGQ